MDMKLPGRQNRVVEELFLLQRVAQRINSTLDLDALLEDIVSDVAQTFGYSRSAVLLKDDRTNELVIAAVRGWTVNFHQKGDRFQIGEYGMVGHVGATEETYYAPDVRIDPYYRVSEEQTRSELDIPLKVRGRLIGVFNAQHNGLDAFPPDRIQLLEALAGHIATAIENARMFQRERLEKERLQKELSEAQRIQHDLFPRESPALAGFGVEGRCIPCREVGGDWYDYIPLPDGRMAVVLGDVSGKGLGAALLMSSTRTVLRLVAMTGLPPGEVLSRVNRILVHDFPAAKFVTLVYAVLDPREGTLVFANAGHPPPLMITSRGTSVLETEAGIPLGIEEGRFSERIQRMETDDRLLLYSDGVTEALDADLQLYGEDRLRARAHDASVEELLEDVRTFSGSQSPNDDITLVLIRKNTPSLSKR